MPNWVIVVKNTHSNGFPWPQIAFFSLLLSLLAWRQQHKPKNLQGLYCWSRVNGVRASRTHMRTFMWLHFHNLRASLFDCQPSPLLGIHTAHVSVVAVMELLYLVLTLSAPQWCVFKHMQSCYCGITGQNPTHNRRFRGGTHSTVDLRPLIMHGMM